MKPLKLFSIAAMCSLLCISCDLLEIVADQIDNQGENQGGAAELTGATIDPALVILQVGESIKLNLIPEPADANISSVIWGTNLENDIISVTPDGTVTAAYPGESSVFIFNQDGEPLAECLVYVYDSIYSLFKDAMPLNGASYYGLTFVRNWFFMTELKGDNVSWSGISSDPLCDSGRYNDSPDFATNKYTWTFCYILIKLVNSKLAKADISNFDKGELLFLRAYSYYCLVNLFAKQYVLGRDNPGVPLVLDANNDNTNTATVGEVYDQIVSDLNMAASLMEGQEVSNKGQASAVAAKALLSRVYLYMEKNQECVEICNRLLAQYSDVLDDDLHNYFINAQFSKETIWCIVHKPEDSKGLGSIGSLYYTPDWFGSTGWGEIYWSDPLIELIKRYPGDKRFQAYFRQPFKLEDGTKMVHWPIYDPSQDYRSDAVVNGKDRGLTPDANGVYTFVYNGEEYSTELKSVAEVNNGYPQYFINYNGEQTQVFIRDNMSNDGIRYNGGSFPAYFNTKFSGQDYDPNLSSPVILRWAEIYLNRAEALAKLGNSSAALADVNVIRARAGLSSEAMMTISNIQSRGYASVLDVVLDERRMEFCFEGQRFFDVYRNKKSMDRRFAGINPWEVINYDDERIPYKKPE